MRRRAFEKLRIGYRRRLALLLLLAAGLSAALAVEWLRDDEAGSDRATLGQLAAKNYRTLSPQESRSLVRYAEKEYSCLVAHGARVEVPVASQTRITMRAPNQSARDLAQLQLACDPEVGPPPSKASLQARQGQVLVYLPKRCLINPTELQ